MKVETKTKFRSATIDDCYAIAQLFRIASDGVSDYIWSTLTSEYPGLTPLEIGVKRYTNEESLFSYKNCVIAEQDKQTLGMMITFPIAATEDSAKPEAEDTIAESEPSSSEPDVLAPYNLEAPGTWYICALALFPQFRGQGIGTQIISECPSASRRTQVFRT